MAGVLGYRVTLDPWRAPDEPTGTKPSGHGPAGRTIVPEHHPPVAIYASKSSSARHRIFGGGQRFCGPRGQRADGGGGNHGEGGEEDERGGSVEGGMEAEEEYGGSGGELGEREREVGAEVVVGVDAGKAALGDLLI
nr:hypothetical protein [Phenylobacterium sp.]